MSVLLVQCKYDHFEVEPPPPVPQATATLTAKFVNAADANTIDGKYWKQADYREAKLEDVSKGLLYGDGYLNMTGTFSGLTGFNGGVNAELILKAAYDNEFL